MNTMIDAQPISSTLIKNAVENNSVFSFQGIQQRIFSYLFDGLVYNQIWEDPRVDLEAMQVDGESRILTISSGGCNLLNYLVAQPHSVTAVDLNFTHICFTRLKLAALKYLPTYDDFFRFYACADLRENVENYFCYIQPHLDEQTRAYWESESWLRKSRIHYFSKNLYNYGAMAFFIRLVHGLSRRFARDSRDLLHISDPVERELFFNQNFAPFFDHPVVKWLGKMPFLFYGLGIPPQQFDAMKQECGGRLNRLYRERVKRLACDFPIEENYFAWQAFGLQYDTLHRRALPDYLKEEYYSAMKNNLDKISLNYTSLTEYLQNLPNGSLNRFVFLDAQDWMDAEMITELWTEVARVGLPGSRIIFRTASNLSPIETALPPALRARFVYEETLSHKLFKQDRSSIYGGFHLYVLKN